MESSSDTDAKSAILQTAQRLFAEDGFEKVSLRRLTQEAGVNLAAVNYHFGSKQSLIDAVIEGFVNPVNEGRLEALRLAEQRSEGAPVPLEEILDCFLRPALENVRRSALSERLFCRLMGRCFNDQPLPHLPASVMALFREVLESFPRSIRRTLPKLSQEEIVWRLHFSVGVLIHVLIHGETMLQMVGSRIGRPEPDALLSRVRAFCCDGFRGATLAFPEENSGAP